MKRSTAITLLLLALLVLLPACRRRVEVLATAVPTLTPTPRSTPLPAVPTRVPPGAEGNPIQVLIVGGDAQSNALVELETTLKTTTSLNVQVSSGITSSEAVAALCQSAGGTASAVWVDVGAYLAAIAQGCGEPALLLERDGKRGDAPVLVANSSARITQVADLTDKVLCQLETPEFFSWLAPTLIGQVEGVDVLAVVARPKTYPDRLAMLKALASGECDVAGIPESALAEYAAALGEDAAKITMVARMPELPYAALVLPNAIPLAAQNVLVGAMSDTNTITILRGLIGSGQIVMPDAAALDNLRSFIASTGLDFSTLGQ